MSSQTKSNKHISIIVLDITLKGGIERFAVNLANSYIAVGYTVTIISIHNTNNAPIYSLNKLVNLKYSTNLPFYEKTYKLTTLIACALLRLKSNIYSSRTTIITHPITSIYLKILGYDMSNIIASEHSAYGAHSKFVQALRIWAYKKVKGVVCQTQNGLENFKRFDISAKLIPNAITEFNDQNQWSFSRRRNFQVLTIARLEPVKQLQTFVDIASEVKQRGFDLNFKIIGDGSQSKAIQKHILEKSLQDLVEIIPATPNVGQFYGCASVYLITSKTESFSMTLTEALSYGIPAISNKSLVGPREIITHGYDGYLCRDGDVKEFANRIIELFEDEKWAIFSKRAIQKSLLYKSDIIIRKWVEIHE